VKLGKGGRVEGNKGGRGKTKGRTNPSSPSTLPPLHPSTPVSRSVSVVVVGAGPAGLAAAVQLVRQGLSTVVLEKDRPGGQIATANLVENYLGLNRLPGAEVARMFVRHAMNAGVRIVRAEVQRIWGHGPFTVSTTEGRWRARAVVVATGAVPRHLAKAKDAVDYDTGDLDVFRQRTVLVLGSGDAAFDRALRILPVAASVRIMCRGKPSALPILVSRCRKEGIPLVAEAGEPRIRFTAGRFEVRTRKGTFRADRLLACVGKTGQPPILPRPLEKLAPAFPSGRTTVPGLCLIGDLVSGQDRYLSVATGMGIAAAMAVGEWLKNGKHNRVGRARSWK